MSFCVKPCGPRRASATTWTIRRSSGTMVSASRGVGAVIDADAWQVHVWNAPVQPCSSAALSVHSSCVTCPPSARCAASRTSSRTPGVMHTTETHAIIATRIRRTRGLCCVRRFRATRGAQLEPRCICDPEADSQYGPSDCSRRRGVSPRSTAIRQRGGPFLDGTPRSILASAEEARDVPAVLYDAYMKSW